MACFRRRSAFSSSIASSTHSLTSSAAVVVGHLLAHLGQALRPHESRAALPAGKAQLIIRPVPARLLGSLHWQPGVPHTLYCSLILPGCRAQFGKRFLSFSIWCAIRCGFIPIAYKSYRVRQQNMQEIQNIILLRFLRSRYGCLAVPHAPAPPAGCSVCAPALLKSIPSKALPAPNGDLFRPSPRTELKRARLQPLIPNHPSIPSQYKISLDHSAGCRTPADVPNGLHRMMYSAIMDNHRTSGACRTVRAQIHFAGRRKTQHLDARRLPIPLARSPHHALADAQPTSVPSTSSRPASVAPGSSLTSAKFAAPRSIPCCAMSVLSTCLELALHQ